MNPAYILARLELFQSLSAAELDKLERLLEVKDYRTGHFFWKEGSQIRNERRALFIILDGQVSVTTEREDLTYVPVAHVLNAGEIFGLISFFQVEVHTATCRAASPVRAASLSRTEYDKLCQTDVALAASVMFAMSRQLAKDVRQRNTQLAAAIQPEPAKAGGRKSA